MSVTEAAAELGVTNQWVIKLVQAGKFPGARKANPDAATSAWLIPTVEFKAYLAEEKKRA